MRGHLSVLTYAILREFVNGLVCNCCLDIDWKLGRDVVWYSGASAIYGFDLRRMLPCLWGIFHKEEMPLTDERRDNNEICDIILVWQVKNGIIRIPDHVWRRNLLDESVNLVSIRDLAMRPTCKISEGTCPRGLDGRTGLEERIISTIKYQTYVYEVGCLSCLLNSPSQAREERLRERNVSGTSAVNYEFNYQTLVRPISPTTNHGTNCLSQEQVDWLRRCPPSRHGRRQSPRRIVRELACRTGLPQLCFGVGQCYAALLAVHWWVCRH